MVIRICSYIFISSISRCNLIVYIKIFYPALKSSQFGKKGNALCLEFDEASCLPVPFFSFSIRSLSDSWVTFFLSTSPHTVSIRNIKVFSKLVWFDGGGLKLVPDMYTPVLQNHSAWNCSLSFSLSLLFCLRKPSTVTILYIVSSTSSPRYTFPISPQNCTGVIHSCLLWKSVWMEPVWNADA